MPTKKIGEIPLPHKGWASDKKRCHHPEHESPTMRVFEPGVYEHTCPACGQITAFTVHTPEIW